MFRIRFLDKERLIPLIISLSVAIRAFGFVLWCVMGSPMWFILGVTSFSTVLIVWGAFFILESFSGFIVGSSMKAIKLGFILFIVSEAFFFSGFFWGFFDFSLSPSTEIGCVWTPVGIVVVPPLSIPLLNTVLLLSSGATLTWCHRAIIYLRGGKFALFISVLLGAVFLVLQGFEYINCPFTSESRCYGTRFFILTGFHGLHVLVGCIFLGLCLLRWRLFSCSKHIGLECSIWYFHFVDVVWLFLFSFVYCWRTFCLTKSNIKLRIYGLVGVGV